MDAALLAVLAVLLFVGLWLYLRHWHKYQAIAVHHYKLIDPFNNRVEIRSSAVVYRCICGKIKKKDLEGVGYLTLEQVTGMPSAELFKR